MVHGRDHRAAQLFGAVEALSERAETTAVATVAIRPPVHSIPRQTVATLRQRLGDHEFAAAWTTGRALSLEQALASAMDEPVIVDSMGRPVAP